MKSCSTTLLALLLCSGPALAVDHSSTQTVGAEMTNAAQQFLASLSDGQRAVGVMAFDNPARLDWHNIPKPERKGLQVRELSARQRELVHALLRAALSEAGYDKAVKIMALEANLHEGEKSLASGPLRDPLRYFITIFGTPDNVGRWGWSFEGHHLSLNFVIDDGQVTSDTPSFWGANPATVHTFVPGGPEVGTRTLAAEEQLAFDLLASLDAAQRKRAVVADKAPAEYRAAGEPQPPRTPPEGVPAADMTDAQQKTLRNLLAAYCGHLTDEVAAVRMSEIDARGLDEVHFAWLGAEQPGVGHSYRVQGPAFVLELVNFQSDPAGNPANHIHSVWRNLEGDFGVEAR
jgi:Protein of unknown function (DUF3500)